MLAQWVAVQLWVPPANVTTVWVEGGILLAAALLTEPRRWPAVIGAGSLGAVFLFLGLQLVAPVSAVVLGVLAGLQTVALAGAFRLVLRGPLTLGTLREFRSYLVVVVVGGAIAAATAVIAAVTADFAGAITAASADRAAVFPARPSAASAIPIPAPTAPCCPAT